MNPRRPILGPPVPTMAPPFPPPAIVTRRRRLRAGLVLVLVVGAFYLANAAWHRHEPPPARARTGTPLPGLDALASDEGWRSAPPEAFRELSWNDVAALSSLQPEDADSHIPAALRELAGKPVMVTGFMVPLDAGLQTTDFVLVPDMSRCWFCEGPDPARGIYARGAFGPVDAIYDRPITARGILDVSVWAPGGRFHSILRLRAVRVEAL